MANIDLTLRMPAGTGDPAVGVPSYSDEAATYFADSCAPLVRAALTGRLGMGAVARGHYPGAPLQQDEAPGLRTCGWWDAAHDQDWGLDWHRNEGIELTYLARGALDFALDEAVWNLTSGHLTVTRPWQKHKVGNPHVGRSLLHWCIIDVQVRRPNQPWRWPDWVSMSPADLARLTELLQHNENPVWPANSSVAFGFKELSDFVTGRRTRTRDSHLRQLVSRILLGVLELLEEQCIPLDARFSSARRSVEMLLDEIRSSPAQRWTLGRMSRVCGLGRTQLTEYCRIIANTTPIQFVNDVRLRQAAELLIDEPKLAITDIAFHVGYESSQYFSEVFSKHFGHSPVKFRMLKRS
jgi:AraC family L-rhamnose operon regulatory protein RhaS